MSKHRLGDPAKVHSLLVEDCCPELPESIDFTKVPDEEPLWRQAGFASEEAAEAAYSEYKREAQDRGSDA